MTQTILGVFILKVIQGLQTVRYRLSRVSPLELIRMADEKPIRH